MARWRCGLTRANRRTIAALIAASALLLALVSGHAQVSPSAAPPVAIEVRAEPITAFDVRDPSLRQFGLLEFRGGLVLRSSYEHFGGISAIRVAPDGAHFIALTDKGWWFRGRIVYEGTRPSGIADAEMAPILGADGRPLAARGWYDTESIAEDGGTLYVGIERVHQIVRFDYGKEGLLARGRPIALPPGLRSLPPQQGDRGPGVRSEGFAPCRHADRDFGARPRQGGQYQRLPHRGSEPRQFHGQAKLELRRHRRRAPARRRRSAAGTEIQLEQRFGRAHAPRRARRDQTGRRGRRSRSVRRRSRLRDRQYGRLERPPQRRRRNRPHAHFGR